MYIALTLRLLTAIIIVQSYETGELSDQISNPIISDQNGINFQGFT